MTNLTRRLTIWTMMMAVFAISMSTLVLETRRGSLTHQVSRSLCIGSVNSCGKLL